jgi:hypothetical protein
MKPDPQLSQVELVLTQADIVSKVSSIRREVRKVFQEEEDEYRLLGYNMQKNLFALL